MVILCFAGRYELADALLVRLARELDAPPGEGEVSLHGTRAAHAAYAHARATRLLFLGDLGGYLEANQASLSLLDEIGDVRQACSQRVLIGFAANQLGDYERAIPTLRESLADAERLGLGSLVATARSNLGVALARTGKLAEAEAVEMRAAEGFEAQGDRTLAGACRIYLAEILAAESKLEAAEEECIAALELLTEALPFRCRALATRAEIALARGAVGEATEHARAASEVLDGLGALEEGAAVVRLAIARARLAAGDVDGARAAIERANERLAERAAKIDDPRHRAFFLGRVTENAATRALALELAAEPPRS